MVCVQREGLGDCMKSIVLSTIAKNGKVKDSKIVQPQNSDMYMRLVKEADERIEADKTKCLNAYKKATLYFAR